MQDSSISFSPIPVVNGLVILDGYVRIKVEKGFLEIYDGIFSERRHQLFSKATCKIKRLAMLDADGYITLEALEWIHSIGAGLIQFGWNGEIILASVSHRDHIAIKRAQYDAVYNQCGLDITVYLLNKKLQGQFYVLSKHAPDTSCLYQGKTINVRHFIETFTPEIEKVKSIPEAIGIEAFTSKVYWDAISKIPLHFENKEKKHIPTHWRTFGARHSLLQPKANHNATNPANAMLNYLYALLNAEARIALMVAGFDPDAGIFHADLRDRASFAYDVMEAGRHAVDDWLLDFIKSRVLTRKYFYEKSSGTIRIHADLAHELAATLPLWTQAIVPVVEEIKRRLEQKRRIEPKQ